MNASELLRSLQEEGVQLWREGEELRYRAPIRLVEFRRLVSRNIQHLGSGASSWWPRKKHDAIRKFCGDLWWRAVGRVFLPPMMLEYVAQRPTAPVQTRMLSAR